MKLKNGLSCRGEQERGCSGEKRKAARAAGWSRSSSRARTSTLELALSDKVIDIVKRIPTSACCNKCDAFACEGKVLKRNEELRSCGVAPRRKTQEQEEHS